MVEPVGSFAALRRSEAARPWPFANGLVKVGNPPQACRPRGGRPSTASPTADLRVIVSGGLVRPRGYIRGDRRAGAVVLKALVGQARLAAPSLPTRRLCEATDLAT
jgi:hypothetical protein